MWINLNNKLSEFKSITLEKLNINSSYLERIDKKYILHFKQLENILDDFKSYFFILEIKWIRIFSYDTIYMDSADYLFYKQHQNKEKLRTKVRTRFYEDSNLTFFEYKQKKDWITNKYRYNSNNNEHWKMSIWKEKIFEWLWKNLYKNWENIPKIFPSIKTKYKRITLVDKTWEERLTIDFDIKIVNLRNEKEIEIDLKNLVIIESKSLKKLCKSTEILKHFWLKKTNSCSKYSLWIIYSWITKKYNTFKKTIKEIETIKNEF